MAFKRADLNYVTTLANANPQDFNLVLADNYRLIHITGLYLNIATAGVSVMLKVNGKQKCLVDCVRFGTGNEPLRVDFDLPNNQTLVAEVKDLAGSAHTNLGIEIHYEVDQDT